MPVIHLIRVLFALAIFSSEQDFGALASHVRGKSHVGNSVSQLLASEIAGIIHLLTEEETLGSGNDKIEKPILLGEESSGVLLKLKPWGEATNLQGKFEMTIEAPAGVECLKWTISTDQISFLSSGSLASTGKACKIEGSSPTKLRWPLAKKLSELLQLHRWENDDEAYPSCKYTAEDGSVAVYTQFTEDPDHGIFGNALCRNTGMMSVLSIMKHGQAFYERLGGMPYASGWLAKAGTQDVDKVKRIVNFAKTTTLEQCLAACNVPTNKQIVVHQADGMGIPCRKPPGHATRQQDAVDAFREIFIGAENEHGGETVHAFLKSHHGKHSTTRTMKSEEECRQLDAAYTCLKMNAVLAAEENDVEKTRATLMESGLKGMCVNPDVGAYLGI